jgi:RNA-directed DNA polymerase
MTTLNLKIGASQTRKLDNRLWNILPWAKISKEVFRLQVRIAKATREGKIGKVKALQRILTSSFYAKCLAVKRVTSNKGARTPGIDGERKV